MKFIAHLFKKLFKIIFWVVLIIVILAIVLYLSAGKLIQHFAPDFISKITQTETTLGDVDISLLSGRIGLNNLAIGNPAGFKDKNAFQLGSIIVNFDPQSVLTNKVVIKDIAISGVNVSTELNAAGKTNITELLDNVNKFVGTDKSAKAQPTQQVQSQKQTTYETSSESQSVVIQDLTIKDSSVRVGIVGQMTDIPLPEIHQQNIGEQRKESWAEIIVGILNTINAESTKAVVTATKEALEKNIQMGKDTAKGLTDTLKNLF